MLHVLERWPVAVVASALSFGCGHDDEKAVQPDAGSPAVEHDSHLSNIQVLPMAPPPGSTNIDLRGQFLVSWSSQPPSKADLEANTTYVCVGGFSVGVDAIDMPMKEPADPPSIQLRAKADMPVDRWCWLRIQQTETMKVPQFSVDSLGDAWGVHFFTGSALRVAKVKWSPKNPGLLSVGFSEQFDASQLTGDFMLQPSGAPLGKCIFLNGGCTTPGSQYLSTAVDVQLLWVLTSAPNGVRIALDGSVMGAVRSVKDGALATGEAMLDAALVRDIAATEFTPCYGEPDTACWIDVKPLPE